MSGMYRVHKETVDIGFEILEFVASSSGKAFKLLFAHITKKYPKYTDRQLRSKLDYYKRSGILSGSAKDGYNLSATGLKVLERLKVARIEQNRKWDKKWRLIAFDIPEEKREARDAIRRLIKQLGCHQLQKSIWIHPLPCLEKFREIQSIYDVQDDLVLMEVQWISNAESLYKNFKKFYPKL